MSKDFKAIIDPSSPRYQEWMDILGTNEIFLKSPIPEFASAPGIKMGCFLQMDLEELTAEQRERMIKHISAKFEIDEAEVRATLDIEGMPILDKDVTIVVHNPQRWL